MKTNFILLLSFGLLYTACTSQQIVKNTNKSNITQNEYKIDKIELKEQTRGTNRSIVFNSSSIITSLNDNIVQSAMLSSEWNKIVNQATLIDLSKIASYESTTTGRYSDRALASTIIITSNGKTYQSASFDAGIPPKELEGLYQLLQGKNSNSKMPKPRTR